MSELVMLEPFEDVLVEKFSVNHFKCLVDDGF